MRPSEKSEAKAAGQKGSPEVVFSTLRTFFHRQRRHRALQPVAIERVIWIGSCCGCIDMADSANKSLDDYPRYLEPGFTPFDPLELAKQTEEIVCNGESRKYTKFSCPRMYGGIARGYACGCCLRCIFCWVHWSRDFPQKHGSFKSPDEVFD